MKKIFLFATMFAISLSMLAQEHMHVWQDGKKTDFVMTDVDSVTFNKMIHNGYEYVDLGLPSGLLWATYNVGATKPEEYGDYFAWGETAPKTEYTYETYKWCDGTYSVLTKYNINSVRGEIDNRTTLELEDDAAHVNWGGYWRMPTKTNMEELYNKCVLTYTTLNGVNGYFVEGPNRNRIFLPMCGFIRIVPTAQGESGPYWSSSLCTSGGGQSNFGYSISFHVDNVNIGMAERIYGMPIRPVCTLNSMSQREMYVWQGGSKTTFVVADVDSVTFGKENTPPATGTENGYEWVDLGLSVKWATCNVGATKPEEYGDYFAWGEVEPKDYYDWSNYKWCKGTYLTKTKYCTNPSSAYDSIVDNKTTLELVDDAAHVNWGGKWRMPNNTELTELRELCTWTKSSQNGVEGYKVTSNKSGYTDKSIFLPMAGLYRSGSSFSSAGNGGYYWSRSLDTQITSDAWGICFYLDTPIYKVSVERPSGLSVRPVCP